MPDFTLTAGRHVVLVDGRPQVYHVAGSGPVCIAHPGGPGVGWEYLRSAELERFLTMVYIEPVGTGDSARLEPDDEGYSLGRYVNHLHAVINSVGASVYLLGHSHGGFVTQRYALRYPDRVTGLIWYSSAPRWDPEVSGDATKQLNLMAERLPHRPLTAVVDAWRAGFEPADDSFTAFFRTILPAYFADYWHDEERLRPLRESVRAWYVPGGLAPFDDREALADLTVRALILVGDYDFICGPRWAAELEAAVPAARTVSFRHSGHMPHLEEPALFAASVADFVRTEHPAS